MIDTRKQYLSVSWVLSQSRFLLSTVGIWPNNMLCSPFCEKMSNLRFAVGFNIIGLTLTFPQIIQMFMVNGDLEKILNLLCIAVIVTVEAQLKQIILRLKSKEINFMTGQMLLDYQSCNNNTTKNNQSLIVHKYAEAGKKFSIFFTWLAHVTPAMYFVLQIFQYYLQDSWEALPYEAYYPINTSNKVWYSIIMFMQFLAACVTTYIISGIVCLYCVLVLHLCGQLTLLVAEVRDLRKNGIKPNVAKLIHRHNEIIRYGYELEETFNKIFFLRILSHIIIVCCQGYTLISIIDAEKFSIVDFGSNLIAIIYVTADVFFYCWISDKPKQKCEELAFAVYECSWYEFEPKVRKDLLLIMQRAQKPLEVTVGKFKAVSIDLFAKITKTSLGYLSAIIATRK